MNRYKIRENLFKLLFLNEFHNSDDMKQQTELFFDREEFEETLKEDKDIIMNRFVSVTEVLPQIDEKINEAAKGWTTDRIGRVELSILRLAIYEMHYDENVPVGVAINEAVELAKKYGQEESSAFINGILAKLVSPSGDPEK